MKKTQEIQSQEILDILGKNPAGQSRGVLAEKLSFPIKDKTLQRRLAALVESGQVQKIGERRATKYFVSGQNSGRDLKAKIETVHAADKDKINELFSCESQKALKYLHKPPYAREKVSYNRQFLEEYVPNKTIYVPFDHRQSLLASGQRLDSRLAAGTYARQIYQRLLIDLSYNSSRLEGNTYSELDTKRLVEEGISAVGKVHAETVMIMNHKEAILFLVENAKEVQPSPFTIYNLHHLLSQDLLANPLACGNVRSIEVTIGNSAYKPLNNPHLLKEMLELLLLKARKIDNAFEQSFFLLVHLSYLQAFEDVNKRTARLACNIPFIKDNLCPLSFTEIRQDDYLAALLVLYETNDIGPLLDLFCWAYLRSCNQYQVVKESIGEIDAFRIQYRQQRKEVMGQVVRNNLHGLDVETHIEDYCRENKIEERDKFVAAALADLGSLHAGAIIGLGITQGQFDAWNSETI